MKTFQSCILNIVQGLVVEKAGEAINLYEEFCSLCEFEEHLNREARMLRKEARKLIEEFLEPNGVKSEEAFEQILFEFNDKLDSANAKKCEADEKKRMAQSVSMSLMKLLME